MFLTINFKIIIFKGYNSINPYGGFWFMKENLKLADKLPIK